MPTGGPIVSIVQCGRLAYCFERDEERYNKALEELKAYYTENIPNVVFK